MKLRNAQSWWGPPKKFSTEAKERKISWLELFYDLVYVIAVSRITHHLAEHLDYSGLLDYTYFFVMIFWGWLNGSFHHDLHGTSGLRTSLMTLWQMLIIAGLVVTINNSGEHLLFNLTIALMVMQLYITYMWWSVGIYDKAHRPLNRPYTILYLTSFALMFLTFFLKQPYIRIVFSLTLFLNYLPPFVAIIKRRNETLDYRLSESMTERLGLFTIIVFGEVILGIVNGVSALHDLNVSIWLNFGLSILIVFALWWIFFSLVSDRPCKKSFLNGTLMQLFFIPALMGLGMTGAAFSRLFESFAQVEDPHANLLIIAFGLSLSIFLLGITLILYFLEYPPGYQRSKGVIQKMLLVVVSLFIILTLLQAHLFLTSYLLIVLTMLILLIIAVKMSWEVEEGSEQ